MALISSQTHSQEDGHSGNALYRGCKAAVDGQVRTDLQKMQGGMCAGTVNTVIVLMNDIAFCPPKGSSLGQAMKILVKHMDDNPSVLHQELAVLAEQALQRAWPCKAN
jgi:hypothetical protein